MLATIVVPVEDESEARTISQSVKRTTDRHGNLTLSFIAGSQTFEYRYEQSDDGLLLVR